MVKFFVRDSILEFWILFEINNLSFNLPNFKGKNEYKFYKVSDTDNQNLLMSRYFKLCGAIIY